MPDALSLDQPKPPARARLRLWKWLALVLVLGAGLYLVYYLAARRGSGPVTVRAAEAVVQTLTVSLTATEPGQIEADTEVRVVPRAPGVITRLYVDEGDEVRAGQVLALLDRDDASVLLEQAEGGLRAAQARLRQAEVAVELQGRQSQADLRRARAAVTAAERAVQAAEARASVQPEQTRIAIRQAEARHQAALAALDLVRRGARTEQIAQAEAAVSQAEANAEEARKALTRAESLFRQGAVAESQVDAARARSQTADAAARSAREQLALLRNQTLPEDLRAAEARVREAAEALEAARSAAVQDELQRREAQAARARLAEARAQLAAAEAGLRQKELREEERRAAEAAVRQAEAALRQARTRYGYTRVTAPVSGTVAQLNVKEGEYVQGGATFGLGTSQLSILSIVNERLLWVRAAIDEADLPRVSLGQRALIYSDAYPRRPFEGTIVEVAPTAQTQRLEGRTFRVKAAVKGAQGKLRPGMSADLEVIVQQVPRALVVPTRAVLTREGRRYVFRVVDARAVRTPVKVGAASLTQTQITSGLRPGDRVVTTVDAEGLRDGAALRLEERP